jgi:hypothetical protein
MISKIPLSSIHAGSGEVVFDFADTVISGGTLSSSSIPELVTAIEQIKLLEEEVKTLKEWSKWGAYSAK